MKLIDELSWRILSEIGRKGPTHTMELETSLRQDTYARLKSLTIMEFLKRTISQKDRSVTYSLTGKGSNLLAHMDEIMKLVQYTDKLTGITGP